MGSNTNLKSGLITEGRSVPAIKIGRNPEKGKAYFSEIYCKKIEGVL